MKWIQFRNTAAEERFEKCKLLAEEHAHLKPSWEQCLQTLERLSTNLKGIVEVYTDFSPLSFNWGVIREDGSCPFNGGLIFHGPHDGFGSGAAPTFSVSLTPEYGWSIHT